VRGHKKLKIERKKMQRSLSGDQIKCCFQTCANCRSMYGLLINFRRVSLMPVTNPKTVRPTRNLSSPKGFRSIMRLIQQKFPKLKWTRQRSLGSLLEASYEKLTKRDQCEAYKSSLLILLQFSVQKLHQPISIALVLG
jgi:hypothetical protein